IRCPHCCFAVTEGGPYETDPRLKVLIVLVVNIVDVRANPDEGRSRRIEDNEPVVPFRGRHVPLVTHPEFEHDTRTKFVVVLREKSERAFLDAARLITQSYVE